MRQSAFTLDQAKEQMTHHPTNCVGVTPFSLLYVPSSRNIILRFACSPQCKFCWIYRLLFDEINGLSIYQKITCDKWVLSPKGHCQNYSQEVSNLIPKSPSNLAIILCYYFNYTYCYSGLEIVEKLTLCTVQCVPLAHFIVHCRIALVTVSADWPSCRSLSRSCQIPSPSFGFWSQGRRNWGPQGGLGGLPPPL